MQTVLCMMLAILLSVGIASADLEVEFSDKIYSHFSLSDDFDSSSIIVILDKKISGINKVHDKNFFIGVEIDEIEDLTKVVDEQTVDMDSFEQILLLTLTQPSKQEVLSAIDKLYLIDGVKYAGANTLQQCEAIPNDSLYANLDEEKGQWALEKILAPEAWEFNTGANGVRIGIMDTGISYHADLDGNVAEAYDFYSTNSSTPIDNRSDIDSHGTHVAGIIGAEGNNALGTCGVNWDISLVQMKVGTKTIDMSAMIRALTWAKNNWNTEDRVSIISCSIGGYSAYPELEVAIRAYCEVGGLFVCSTGNREQDNDLIGQHHYPSFYASELYSDPIENMITVGRSDINDEKPNGANWGSQTVMLYAPGQNILSTYPTSLCESNEEYCTNGHIAYGYHLKSGSSMSTPYVSGVAALLLSINPNLSANELKTAILNSVDLPSIGGDNPLQGMCVTNGRLNAYKAVKYVLANYSPSMTLDCRDNSTSSTLNSTSDFFYDRNCFVRLNIAESGEYNFDITSLSAIDVVLYDSDMDEINIQINSSDAGATKSLTHNLSIGQYYLRVNYPSDETSGTINININNVSHVHVFNEWAYYNKFQHIEACRCGEIGTVKQAHIIPAGSALLTAVCLHCGHIIDLRFDGGVVQNANIKRSLNGSYIIPSNGIIVLVNDDFEAYFDGTLIFYTISEMLGEDHIDV